MNCSMIIHMDTPVQATPHANPKLTFIIGTVVGIALMTLAELAFMSYALSGGNIGTYTVAPLESVPQFLGQTTQPVESVTATVAVPSEHYIFGAETNYKVTLVEYVDFECRFCKKFFPEVQQFVNDHPDTVRLIIKQYPLTQIHPQAQAAAKAAVCSANQNKFMPYAEEVFKFQTNLQDAIYSEIAKTIGLNTVDFDACLADTATMKQVQDDSVEAEALGIRSQPALIIWHNDGKLEIIDSYVNKAYLESALGGYLK